MVSDEEALIKEQIEYYRARTDEYDEWFNRVGRYYRGEEHSARWSAEVEVVREALRAAKPGGKVLELACGTGLWTKQLAPLASRLVAVDVSQEAITANRRKVADNGVEYVQADLFSWQPQERFDFVFFSFWLSHVPLSRLERFWAMVREALAPGGKVFFLDNLFTQDSTAGNHAEIDRSGRAKRKLNDGREFEIVKIFHDPVQLEERLKRDGWKGHVRGTETFFLYGCLERDDD